MNLKQLNGEALVSKTASLVAEERRLTLELIEHLREIERRMLFADLGYGSLFDFCVRHLGLSEGSAHRRISAMRLIHEVPEAKAALEEGKLSLTNASKLQSVFQSSKRLKHDLKREEKLEVLEQVTGLTQKECETRLFEVLPVAMTETTRERERPVNADSTELKLLVDGALYEKLTRLKELLSHKFPTGSTLELLEYLVEKELVSQEKKRGLDDKRTTITSTPGQNETTQSSIAPVDKATLSKAEKRIVWRRAHGRCEIPNCRSRYQLQVDHIISRALGGTDELSNLRLVCRTHNANAARKNLGASLMRKYLPRTKAS